MSAATSIQARVTLPNLGDTSRYLCLPGTPILDSHYRKTIDKDGNSVDAYCGPDQLQVLCRNSQARAVRGDFAVVRVGHVNVKLENHRERDQPEIIGFIPKFYMGELNDTAVILADVYIKKEYANDLEKYPRRSPEIFGKNDPDGFIDGLALLNRPPERDLGLVTYSKLDPPYYHENGSGSPGERTMIDENDCQMLAQAVVTALQSFFESQAGGGEPGDDAPVAAEPMMADGMSGGDPMPPESMDAAGGGMGCGMGAPAGGSSFPGGTSTFIPGENKEEKPKDMDHMQSNASTQELIDLRGQFELFKRETNATVAGYGNRVKELERDLGEKNMALRKANRTATLTNLRREGIILNVDKELELCMSMTDVDFGQNVTRIRENYSRDISGRPFIEVDNMIGSDASKEVPKNRMTSREKDANAVVLYQKDHPDLPRGEIVSRFLADTEYRKRFTA